MYFKIDVNSPFNEKFSTRDLDLRFGGKKVTIYL